MSRKNSTAIRAILIPKCKMNFLINPENFSESQAPSKLIDYGFTGRPIYSFDQLHFSVEALMKFFDGDYSQTTTVDLEQFDIKNVAGQFLQLSKGSV